MPSKWVQITIPTHISKYQGYPWLRPEHLVAICILELEIPHLLDFYGVSYIVHRGLKTSTRALPKYFSCSTCFHATNSEYSDDQRNQRVKLVKFQLPMVIWIFSTSTFNISTFNGHPHQIAPFFEVLNVKNGTLEPTSWPISAGRLGPWHTLSPASRPLLPKMSGLSLV